MKTKTKERVRNTTVTPVSELFSREELFTGVSVHPQILKASEGKSYTTYIRTRFATNKMKSIFIYRIQGETNKCWLATDYTNAKCFRGGFPDTAISTFVSHEEPIELDLRDDTEWPLYIQFKYDEPNHQLDRSDITGE